MLRSWSDFCLPSAADRPAQTSRRSAMLNLTAIPSSSEIQTCIYGNVSEFKAQLRYNSNSSSKLDFLSTTPLPSPFRLLEPSQADCADYVPFSSSISPSQKGLMTRLTPGPKAKCGKNVRRFYGLYVRLSYTSNEKTHT